MQNKEIKYENNLNINNLCAPPSMNEKNHLNNDVLNNASSSNNLEKINLSFNLNQKSNISKNKINLAKRIIFKHGQIISEDVTCKLCKDILYKPIHCNKCTNFFCSWCIKHFSLSSPYKCPCKSQEDCFSEPHKILFSLLKNYNFHCQRYSQGCHKEINYLELDEHEKICEFRKINCQHPNCDKEIFMKDFEDHFKHCENQIIDCCYCKKKGLKKMIDDHIMECDQRLINCEDCFQSFCSKDFHEHLKNCQEIHEQCLKCNLSIKRKNFQYHDDVQCISFLYENTRNSLNSQIKNLSSLLEMLENKVKEKEQFFASKCLMCNKFACQVSQKNCIECGANYCIPCSKKKIKNCKECDKIICSNCTKSKDHCDICHTRLKKIEKRGGGRRDIVKHFNFGHSHIKNSSTGMSSSRGYIEQKIENIE